MPAPVKQPALAMVGLAVVALLCIQLLKGAITLETAALRTVVAVVVLAAADRLLVPIGRALMGEPGAGRRRPAPIPDDAEER